MIGTLKRTCRDDDVPRFDDTAGSLRAEACAVRLRRKRRDLNAAANRGRYPFRVGDEIVDDLVSGGKAILIDPGEGHARETGHAKLGRWRPENPIVPSASARRSDAARG